MVANNNSTPNLQTPLKDLVLVAFDTETSGAYPVGSDVVEFGAVKYANGKMVDKLEFLFRPREPMKEFIIKIHGITNEMVKDSPLISDKINEIHNFFQGSVLIAHHAPFDLGFMAYDFEKANLDFPKTVNLCSSLLSRKLIPESGNHKLQTLVKFLGIDGGSAHRAFDDAQSCYQVAATCFARTGDDVTLEKILSFQKKNLDWDNYKILDRADTVIESIVEAIQTKKILEIVYDRGSRPGQARNVIPWGIVRNPDGDYLMAYCKIDNTNKRFYLSEIKQASIYQ